MNKKHSNLLLLVMQLLHAVIPHLHLWTVDQPVITCYLLFWPHSLFKFLELLFFVFLEKHSKKHSNTKRNTKQQYSWRKRSGGSATGLLAANPGLKSQTVSSLSGRRRPLLAHPSTRNNLKWRLQKEYKSSSAHHQLQSADNWTWGQ